jgi:hypothetical protein
MTLLERRGAVGLAAMAAVLVGALLLAARYQLF